MTAAAALPAATAAGRTPPPVMTVLSVMMLLQHGSLGAFVPVLPLHFQDLGFTGLQTGIVFALFSVASLVSPSLFGQLADRRTPAPYLLAGCHLGCAAAVWFVAPLTGFAAISALMLLHALLYVPTLALSNMVAFRHIVDREREYGSVRFWGTFGWVAASGLVSLWLWHAGERPGRLADALRIGAVLSVLAALVCLVLPATPPSRGGASGRLALRGALRLLRDPSFAAFMLTSFLIATLGPFVYPVAARFLRALGASDAAVGPLLSLGQVTELLVLLTLGLGLRRFGYRTLFVIGAAAWAVRFSIWCGGGPWWLIVASLALHGVCYGFIFALGQVYVDHRTPADARASAQSLHLTITTGLGTLVGNLAAGFATDAFVPHTAASTGGYALVFLGPALLATVCAGMFAAFFNESTRTPDSPSASAADPE